MNEIIIIKRENKKAHEVVKKLHEAKAALHVYLLKGCDIKDYNPRKLPVA